MTRGGVALAATKGLGLRAANEVGISSLLAGPLAPLLRQFDGRNKELIRRKAE
jgi:hypothetical protein